MADTNRKDSCANCLFFVEEHRNGSCKRYPESIIKGSLEWCGEFRYDASKEKPTPRIEITFNAPPEEISEVTYDIVTDTISSITKTLTAEPTPEPVKKPGRPKKVAK